MEKIYFITKRMSVQMQRLLMMMATILMAFATLTACDILEDNNDEGGKEEEGGNGGGGGIVSGKRVKSIVTTCSNPVMYSRTESIYNSSGQCIRGETYDASSKLIDTSISTYNSDGTLAKTVTDQGETVAEFIYFYNSNKILQKSEHNFYQGGVLKQTTKSEYTYENGKKIRQKSYMEGQSDYNEFLFNYDGNGRRTTTVQTYYGDNLVFSMTHTRTYNTDGTVQKITHPVNFVDNTPVTITFTWENGKDATLYMFDMVNPW